MANHPSRLLILATMCAAAAIVAVPGANAASKFDGTWTAVFRTKAGPCQPAYRGAVQVVDGVMQVGGTMGSLLGRVSRNGSVRATGYTGANYGVASGRVSGNFGSGTWRAHTEGGNCAGVWNAQRRYISTCRREAGSRIELRRRGTEPFLSRARRRASWPRTHSCNTITAEFERA